MIEFKETFTELLPYDRHQYIEFLFDESDSAVKWYGVSFQLKEHGKQITLTQFIEMYQPWLKNIILSVGQSSDWIVNHDKADLEWFPNDDDNLKSLRDLFSQNNVSKEFKGAIIFSEEILIQYLQDLITYPYGIFNEDNIFYMNIDISHCEFPFIIKILDHLNIDLLSTNKNLLKEIVIESNSTGSFTLKPYRGTTL